MPAVVFWALVVVGATQVVCVSKIFRLVRAALPRLPLSCCMCVGWWIGLVLALVPGCGLARWASGCSWWAAPWLDAFAASAVAWASQVALVRLGANEL